MSQRRKGIYEISESYYGKDADIRGLPLPFFKQFVPPLQPLKPDLSGESLLNACGTKIIVGGITGGVLGVGLGLFMGAMSGDVSPIQIVNGREVPQAPLREQVRAAFKATGSKSIGWMKNFGVLTALFGGIECVIEKYRAKHDVWNAVISGCAVGATLSAKAGPAVILLYFILVSLMKTLFFFIPALKASCIGCVGFGGFSFVVDQIMGPH